MHRIAEMWDKISRFVPHLILFIMVISYFIRKNNKLFQNICFRLRDGRKVDLHHKSNIIIDVADWDCKNNRIKQPSGNINDEKKKRLSEINDKVDLRSKIIRDVYLAQTNTMNITSEWLDIEIDKKLYPQKHLTLENSQPPDTLIAYVEDFIKNAPLRRTSKNTFLSPGTIKSYNANLMRLKLYAEYKRKDDFLMSEVDKNFVRDYVNFLTDRKRIVKTKGGEVVNETKQYTNNTIGNAMKLLKTFLMAAPGHKVVFKDDLEVYKEEVDSVYLNETELQLLKVVDLSKIPHLERVRDWFLLLAWTGSRYSDLEKIGKANIKNGMIAYRQKKTNTPVTIPLHPVVVEILQKYNYEMPEIISNQKFNDYIKEVCKLAGIVNNESITRTVGGKLVTENLLKYELVSSHTCRRSFCTNMYLRGLDTLMIRSISGHKTEKSFLGYIKVSQQQHAEMMAKKWSEIYK